MAENRPVRRKRYVDYSLLVIVFFLLAFGLVMVYSTSSYSASLDFEGDSLFYLKRQLISVVVGLLAMAITSLIPYTLYSKLRHPALLAAVGSIMLILTPLGYTANGARRWLRFGPLSIQPAEICKIAIIIFTAALLTQMSPSIREGWKGFWFPIVPTGIICLMVFVISDDLSSAIIIGLIPVFMVLVSERKNIWPILILTLMVTVGVFAVLFVVKGWIPASMSFRLERILAWLNPEAYADGKGMQILQSLYGIGSGGVWGKGLGKSMQKLGFLPEAQNDMIFSIICEELGLVGGLSVIMMFILLLWRIRDITAHSKDYFGNMLVSGIFIHIAIQVILNICVVTNTIPNTGISLPFISYGGSSVIFLMAEIGIVMNVGSHVRFVEEEADEQENPYSAETD